MSSNTTNSSQTQTQTPVFGPNILTPDEIHAREQDEAKKTLDVAKDLRRGMSIADVRAKYNTTDAVLVHRLATSTQQLHEILEVKHWVSFTSILVQMERLLTKFSQDRETQTNAMAHNNRGRGLPMPEAVERTYEDQIYQREQMMWDQYRIPPGTSGR